MRVANAFAGAHIVVTAETWSASVDADPKKKPRAMMEAGNHLYLDVE